MESRLRLPLRHGYQCFFFTFRMWNSTFRCRDFYFLYVKFFLNVEFCMYNFYCVITPQNFSIEFFLTLFNFSWGKSTSKMLKFERDFTFMDNDLAKFSAARRWCDQWQLFQITVMSPILWYLIASDSYIPFFGLKIAPKARKKLGQTFHIQENSNKKTLMVMLCTNVTGLK